MVLQVKRNAQSCANDIDSLFEAMFSPLNLTEYAHSGVRGRKLPLLNLSVDKEGKYFKIEAAIAGYKNVTAEVEGNEIVIKGESIETDDATYILKEISTRSFTRSIVIPNSVDKKNILAIKENGILIITMPVFESELPRQLQIEEK